MARITRPHRAALATLGLTLLVAPACSGNNDSVSLAATTEADGATDDQSTAGNRAAVDKAPAEANPLSGSPSGAGVADSPSGAGVADSPTGVGVAGSPSGVGAPENVSPLGTGSAAEADRLLIVDVTVGVEVTDVGSGVADVVDVAARHGGQVYGSDVQLGDPEYATARIVIKLPPEELEAAIAELGALGRFVSRFQNTDDVTDQVMDVNTRILTAQQSVDRVTQLLASAKDLGEVVLLESELTRRQTELEQLLAQQRNLANLTARATLTVELTPLSTDVEPVVRPDIDIVVDDNTVGNAFRRGGEAFVRAAAVVLIGIGLTAPFLALGSLAAVLVWRLSRRVSDRPAPPRPRSRSAAPPPPPAPGSGQRTTEPDFEDAART